MKLFSCGGPAWGGGLAPVAVLGGCWSCGSFAGGFCWSVDTASGARYRNISGHLLNAQGK